MANFFFKPMKGLKSEIARHNKYEADLLDKISKLDLTTDMGKSVKVMYDNILARLRNSRDQFTSQIGKK